MKPKDFEFPVSNTIRIDLDTLKNWEFSHKGKIYKLNVKELLRLLKLVKHETR